MNTSDCDCPQLFYRSPFLGHVCPSQFFMTKIQIEKQLVGFAKSAHFPVDACKHENSRKRINEAKYVNQSGGVQSNLDLFSPKEYNFEFNSDDRSIPIASCRFRRSCLGSSTSRSTLRMVPTSVATVPAVCFILICLLDSTRAAWAGVDSETSCSSVSISVPSNPWELIESLCSLDVSVKFEFELLPDSMMRCELCLPNFGCPLKDPDLESSDCEFSGEEHSVQPRTNRNVHRKRSRKSCLLRGSSLIFESGASVFSLIIKTLSTQNYWLYLRKILCNLW